MILALPPFIYRVPVVRGILNLRYRRRFRTGRQWTFYGVFHSYEEALRAAGGHPVMPPGYNTPKMAAAGLAEYERMYGFDYPAMFWIVRALVDMQGSEVDSHLRVADLGGHLGEKYRVYRERWPMLNRVAWTVCDTPSVVAAAECLDSEARLPGLEFTSDRGSLNGADVLFSSGALQYLDTQLIEILDDLRDPPAHLVINKVPLADHPTVWTLQNGWEAVLPYRIFNRSEFLDGLAERGYEVVDEWSIPEISADVPFHDTIGTEANSGLCLSRGSLAR